MYLTKYEFLFDKDHLLTFLFCVPFFTTTRHNSSRARKLSFVQLRVVTMIWFDIKPITISKILKRYKYKIISFSNQHFLCKLTWHRSSCRSDIFTKALIKFFYYNHAAILRLLPFEYSLNNFTLFNTFNTWFSFLYWVLCCRSFYYIVYKAY